MKTAPWAAVLLVLLSTAAIRFRLLQMPLERDEGEYAYASQLMLEGIPPYKLACNMKLPGTYAAYALLMGVLGQTTGGIHLGLLLVNAAAIILVALLGMRLFGTASGIAASAAYALMSVGSAVMGTQAHATHFVVLAALAGTLMLLRYLDSPHLATLCASGLLFGLAFVMKQHGIFFGAFAMLCLIAAGWRNPRPLLARLMLFGGALAAPFGLTCLLLWRAGVFERFWFWTFTYARAYVSEVSLSQAPTLFAATFIPLLWQNAALWILAGAGLMRVCYTRARLPSAVFAAALLFFSFLAVCPGLYFRPHYYVMLLPAVALLAGAAVGGKLSYYVFGAAFLLSLFTQRDFLFRMSPVEATREIYGYDPFPETIPVADYIRAHSPKNSSVAVLGSEPEIYFYAARHSATSFIYTYGLVEAQPYALTMQQDMIREVTAAAPEFVVEVNLLGSWMPHQGAPTSVFTWWSVYRRQHYRLVGVADISRDHTEYRWGAAAAAYEPRSVHIDVYQRSDTI